MIQLHQYYNHATGLSMVSLSLNICSTLIDFNVTEVRPGLEEKTRMEFYGVKLV